MRIRLPRAAIGNLRQKAVAVVLLIGVLLEIGGVPVVRTVRKDRSRPYPCQDHPCGCASADECWHHCCCMNNKQKVVWASEHGVTPPDFVIAAAAQETEEPTQICDHDECGSCATAEHSEERACCRHRKNRDCVTSTDKTSHASATDRTETRVKLVLSDFARRCSGLPPIIMLFGDALPCVRNDAWKPVEGRVEYVIEIPRSRVTVDLSPPVPPPKLCRGVAA
jgi:hypothetical protein